MPGRVNLPGADELFGVTEPIQDKKSPAARRKSDDKTPSGPTGRVRHAEKITVYVSTDELLNLEQLRLRLRADHGISIDRGRLVRVAIGLLTDELVSGSENEALLERLRQ